MASSSGASVASLPLPAVTEAFRCSSPRATTTFSESTGLPCWSVSDPNQADGEFQFSMIWVLLQAESSEEASNTYESRLTGIKEFRVRSEERRVGKECRSGRSP